MPDEPARIGVAEIGGVKIGGVEVEASQLQASSDGFAPGTLDILGFSKDLGNPETMVLRLRYFLPRTKMVLGWQSKDTLGPRGSFAWGIGCTVSPVPCVYICRGPRA